MILALEPSVVADDPSMNSKIRLLIGSVAGTVAVHIVAFMFWGTSLSEFVRANAGEPGDGELQRALAATLPRTGHYVVPTPGTPGGVALYNRGPIAVIDYNSSGYPVPGADLPGMIGGLLQGWVTVTLIGFALLIVSERVTDFKSRALLVVGISAASAMMIVFSHAIFSHTEWHYAIYNVVANVSIICAGGLVMARWSLPRPKA
jgi:hypothetical protein